jgi:ribosomal protein S18 acetylase RimI-like enzyme
LKAQETYEVRPGGADDLKFLWDMLYEAANWRPNRPRLPREEALASPELSVYLEDWGRPGDASVVAATPDGRRVGAAWYRLFTPERPAFGFVDERTPELGIGIVAGWRGRGVGRALLEALFRQARTDGFEALSLSVERENERAVRLYEKSGFVKLFAVEEPEAWTMKIDVHGPKGL